MRRPNAVRAGWQVAAALVLLSCRGADRVPAVEFGARAFDLPPGRLYGVLVHPARIGPRDAPVVILSITGVCAYCAQIDSLTWAVVTRYPEHVALTALPVLGVGPIVPSRTEVLAFIDSLGIGLVPALYINGQSVSLPTTQRILDSVVAAVLGR